MRKNAFYLAAASVLAALLLSGQGTGAGEEPVIADHNCTYLNEIPDSIIDLVQSSLQYHYAHTSHGGQIPDGLYVIEDDDPKYDYEYQNNSLPQKAGAVCIFNGQESETYITPELYWQTESGMDKTRAVLSGNSEIDVSIWAWCSQLDYYSEQQVEAYLDSISRLESEFPEVTFIYMTGNAQATGSGGHNRYLRNEQIRQFCQAGNKVMFDFAELDCWWYNTGTEEWEFNSYDYEGTDVPVEHEQFNGGEASHTTWESCEQKGKAFWYLSAMLTGWSDPSTSVKSSWGGMKSLFIGTEEDSI